MSVMGSSLSQMRRHFTNERFKPHVDRAMLDRLEVVAIAAVHRENESGGQARHVVAEVARVLGVDIDEGDGHRWDPDHMARVVKVADEIREKRDGLAEEVELWKSLAQRQDNTAPIRMELSTVRRERDDWKVRAERGEAALAKYPVRVMLGGYEVLLDHVWTDTDRASADVLEAVAATAPVGSLIDELKATIVRQAREITQLKGEGE